jgi:hypothetical protein
MEKHGALLAGLTGKTCHWCQGEVKPGCDQMICQQLPILLRQDHPKVGHRHHMIPDFSGPTGGKDGAEMQGNLVAKEVEIDPGLGAASRTAAQQATVKGAGLVQIIYVVGEVKDAHVALS